MLALWGLVILSFAIIAWVEWIEADLKLSGEANRELEARAMAHSGMAVALHPLVSKTTPLLEEQFAPDLGYRVKIVSEGGKLNINWLLQDSVRNGEGAARGAAELKLSIWKQWLTQRGLDFQEIEVLTDSLLDYLDGDNLKRLNGTEDDEGDNYHPPNRGTLQSLEELYEVANMAPLLRTGGWRDELTIFSQGPIDLVAATPEMLALIPGLGETRIQAFLVIRRGKDGLDGTLDDYQFKNLEEVRPRLGLSTQQWQQLTGLIGLNDQTLHITAEGLSAKFVRQVEAVVRKSGTNPTILDWKE